MHLSGILGRLAPELSTPEGDEKIQKKGKFCNEGLVQTRVKLGGVKLGAASATKPCLITCYVRHDAAGH